MQVLCDLNVEVAQKLYDSDHFCRSSPWVSVEAGGYPANIFARAPYSLHVSCASKKSCPPLLLGADGGLSLETDRAHSQGQLLIGGGEDWESILRLGKGKLVPVLN
jgi:hypothetical protein